MTTTVAVATRSRASLCTATMMMIMLLLMCCACVVQVSTAQHLEWTLAEQQLEGATHQRWRPRSFEPVHSPPQHAHPNNNNNRHHHHHRHHRFKKCELKKTHWSRLITMRYRPQSEQLPFTSDDWKAFDKAFVAAAKAMRECKRSDLEDEIKKMQQLVEKRHDSVEASRATKRELADLYALPMYQTTKTFNGVILTMLDATAFGSTPAGKLLKKANSMAFLYGDSMLACSPNKSQLECNNLSAVRAGLKVAFDSIKELVVKKVGKLTAVETTMKKKRLPGNAKFTSQLKWMAESIDFDKCLIDAMTDAFVSSITGMIDPLLWDKTSSLYKPPNDILKAAMINMYVGSLVGFVNNVVKTRAVKKVFASWLSDGIDKLYEDKKLADGMLSVLSKVAGGIKWKGNLVKDGATNDAFAKSLRNFMYKNNFMCVTVPFDYIMKTFVRPAFGKAMDGKSKKHTKLVNSVIPKKVRNPSKNGLQITQ